MVSAHVALNIFDAIVFGILGLSALLSLFRGFIREVLSLVAWIGAAMITLYNVERVSHWLIGTIKSPLAAVIVATLGTYFTALIVISILNSILLRYIKPGKEVGAVDNFLGLLFGLFKGSLIVVLGFYILTLVYNEDSYPDYVKNAWSRPYVEQGTKVFVSIMPGYLKDLTSLVKKEAPDTVKLDKEAIKKAEPKDGDTNSGYDNDTVKKLQDLLDRRSADETPAPGDAPKP